MTSHYVTGALLLIWICVVTGSLVRKSVDRLSDSEVLRLRSVLRELEADTSLDGFQHLASFHGEPSRCIDSSGGRVACCVHGEPTFPMWHRAYVVQFEQLLVKKGLSHLGVPYWDWTEPLTQLPELVQHGIFKDPGGGIGQRNPWFSAEIKHGDVSEHTARAVDDRLFEHVERGQHTRLFDMILDALEQDDYCHFEAQFEVAHNHIHYLVGGRHHYSMSTLEYTAYDPLFFLHHSNVDRIFVIWQELQKKRKKPHDHADCSVELFSKPLQPFSNSVENPVQLTHIHSKPKDLFSHLKLNYQYDSLKLNGMSVNELHRYLEQRKGRERRFASFSLHSIGFSANVRVKVCQIHDEYLDKGEEYCELAGDFFLLGGANEMDWEFKVPYHFDVTETHARLAGERGGYWGVRGDVYSVNGTFLGSHLLDKPRLSHRPGNQYSDPPIPDGRKKGTVVRKDVELLSEEEVYHLRQALERFQNDSSIDGFQAVAEFHGLPAKCPHPDAAVRYACCVHGSPIFLHWHRLFTTEVEDELKSRGLEIGIPYWDWTRPNTHIPALAAPETYVDPVTKEQRHNPFHDALVAFRGERTTRDVQSELSESASFGDHTSLFDAMLVAFEQTDFCDFEIQFEVVHNAIHYLVGGHGPYTMATLHYSAFDPIFYLLHSSVDRMWAIWQRLQIRRGMLYKAHCAESLTEEKMKPFGFPPPYHNDRNIHEHAYPFQVYDYENDLHYTYDSLQFGGMTIEQLEHYLEERKTHHRTFVGIMLHGIGVSAWVTVSLERPNGELYKVGQIGVLGGEKEIPWNFDRPYKLEITDTLHKLGLKYTDDLHVHLNITDVKGQQWPEDTFHHSTIIHQPPSIHDEDHFQDSMHIRNDLSMLTVEQQQELREALAALMEDHSEGGFHQIASFHGEPRWCPSPQAEHKLACCPHGMAVFPHWHRLLTVQAENALLAHGMHSGLPYWDWTLPMTRMPEFFSEEKYVNPKTGEEENNPWFKGCVDSEHCTSRSVRVELFQEKEFGELTFMADQVMLAFEQDNFCDFEIQFEIVHNYIHALVGGSKDLSMASLRYTAFDPLFFLHHSNTDRLWAIWQVLQRYRGKPYNSANCAIAELRQPLQPFAQSSLTNPDHVTRDHSSPFDAFKYRENYHYQYDNLQFNGMSPPMVHRETIRRQSQERVFAGFMLHGIKTSALVVFEVCTADGTCRDAGEFYLLGDENEIPWEYNRLYKYDITNELKKLDLEPKDPYSIHYTVYDLHGSNMGSHLFGNATIVYYPRKGHLKGHEQHYMEELRASSHVRKNLDTLTMGEQESLKSALHDMEEDGSFEHIAKFHGFPGLCHGKGCCVHGSPAFPHWHRLHVEQVENELLKHGSAVSIPYWDWTEPFSTLPDMVAAPTYYDSRTQRKQINPFFRWAIPETSEQTTRDPRFDLFDHEYFMTHMLLALEQRSYCDFEVQFEVTHNVIHSFLGGRGEYSMSTLDYTAFDPIFYIIHTQVDRLFAMWQALQTHRGLPSDESDCGLNLMSVPLHPFDDEEINHLSLTHKYSRPADVWDYSNHLHYHYDNLEFHQWSIPELEEVLKKQRSRDRLFAGFLLHGIGTSAVVELSVCVDNGAGGQSCGHPAGKFSLLGGHYEMPFTFDRLYKHDISDAIRKLGLPLDSAADFDLEVKIHSYNGSYIDPSLLSKPTILFQPGEGKTQDDMGHTRSDLVRKEVHDLSPVERRSLVLAMRSLQHDSSTDGFQALAAFHALPPLCPSPEAKERFACCVHGKATFPHWHRLYTVQFEEALRRHGAMVGIPYWDTLVPQSELPAFFNDVEWDDPILHTNFTNPWHGADIEFVHQTVHREVNMERLGQAGPHGYDTWSWKQYIFALEQENYCDFEVQFEIAHNAIHNWMGGSEMYSMGHLHFASYDPVFILHHSHVDRIFAVWQKLQEIRGHDPNEVHCALDLMREPMKPFSFGPPYNLNPDTLQYSRPQDALDYHHHFHYTYDTYELQGMDARRLQDYINEQKEHDREFAGFLLSGLGTSAHVDFFVCDDGGDCTHAGHFDMLGGSQEMPWRFDRLYQYEITDVLKSRGFDVHDVFHFEVNITAQDGTTMDSSLIPTPSVIFKPKSRHATVHDVATNHVRHDLSQLSERDIVNFKMALRDLQTKHEESDDDDYQLIASFHGAPALCPSPEAPQYACCVHGVPTFPHWHRLYTVEMEDALIRHGSGVALPYWDWTRPLEGLPEVFTSESFYDVWRDEVLPNPFVRARIDSANGYTVRDPQPELTKLSRDGQHSVLFDEVLLALEQTDYCDFEVQFEVTHNAIHYLVGGRQLYSMSSLDYTSYDPIFFVHHSFVDKVWAVWQELQKRRGLVYDRADCAVNFMKQSMHPFDWPELNKDVRTREHAMPNTVFDYEDLGYYYDNFELGGNSLEELEQLIHDHQGHPRVFAGFHLHSISTSADIMFRVCRGAESQCVRAGGIFILGGQLEMPWAFDRLYKYDITDVLHDMGIEPEDVFNAQAPFVIKYEVTAVNGTTLAPEVITPPTLIYQPAHGAPLDHSSTSITGEGVRKDINTLTNAEIDNLRDALRRVQEGTGRLSYDDVAKAHGYPPQCKWGTYDVACCHHGMASFPAWHRVFTRQMEVALTWAGAMVGIPYWDWTQPYTELPLLVSEEEHNPFHHGHIPGKNNKTTRSPRPQLFKDVQYGEKPLFYELALLAFEQRDFCDFEVQLEVLHNALHSWIGGTSPYGMSTLEFTAYDPLFFIHHSNVDRQFAIWQALQKHRGLDYNTANCNIQELLLPLEPFSRDDNPVLVTRSHARGIDAFNYEQYNYQYDDLNFHGMSVDQLDKMLEGRKEKDRVFLNWMLHGIKKSADVFFNVCNSKGKCVPAGSFAILGGPLEMPWRFDRLYKYEVTAIFKQMRLKPESNYTITWTIRAVNGMMLDPHVFEDPSVSFEPGRKQDSQKGIAHEDPVPLDMKDVVRHQTFSMDLHQLYSFWEALYELKNDQGPNGYEAIASFHGAPGLCPEHAQQRYSCCQHGMPAFPHWHRLLTVQFEQALRKKGSQVGIPYWDWTANWGMFPPIFTNVSKRSPMTTYRISFNGEFTKRQVQEELFNHPDEGDPESLFHQALAMLEETNYCDFEVQYEMLHNSVHYLVGGNETYGMSTLEYSAFDPFFMVHHSSIDRLWVIWQTLQKLRHKPFNNAHCAGRRLDRSLEPFSYESINHDPLTLQHSRPTEIFDFHKFHYRYDSLALNGHSVGELHAMIQSMQAHTRVFAGFVLSGLGTSARVHVDIVSTNSELVSVGTFFILGGPTEMPWAYERIYKLDMTEAAKELELGGLSPFNLKLTVTKYDGTPMDVTLQDPVIVKRRTNSDFDELIVPLKKDNNLPPKMVVRRGTRVMFHSVDGVAQGPVREVGSYTNSLRCATPPGKAHSYDLDVLHTLEPGDYFFVPNIKEVCEGGMRLQISVDDD